MGIYEIEPSVQMRLYTLNKRQFVLVFVTFFLCFGISVLIGLAGPPITDGTSVNASSLNPAVTDLKKGPFLIRSPEVSTFHQQLWLLARIDISRSDDGSFDLPFTIGMQIRGILNENSNESMFNGQIHNRSRTLHCSKACDEIVLLHLSFLDYPNYLITVTFYGLDSLKYEVKDIEFMFKMYNPSFTQLEIWFRFVFLVMIFLTTCMFAHALRKFSIRDWSIEQKWMSLLLPLLLLFNNPIFALTFLVNSWIPGVCDVLFQATFLLALLLFWLCLYHGVRENKRRCSTFYFPKLLIVGLIWFSAVFLSSFQEYKELQDPTYNYKLDTGNFLGLEIFFLTMASIYILYLVYLLVRAYAELKNMPYFDLRLKFMTALMVIVLSITIAITILRFGANIFKDNFVAELATQYDNSVEFLSFYGLLNFYLCTMAFVYSPAKNAILESHFRDNPALSMLNDSDDDVIYGSDHEEVIVTRNKSQRNGHAHTRLIDSDDDDDDE